MLITDTIFNSGVFGNRESHVLSEAVKMKQTENTKNVKKTKLIRTIFMPYSSMCDKYKFLKKIPILLPIMWIVRWFDALLFKKRNIKKTMEEINLMQKQKIEEQITRMEKVGLAFNFTEKQ